jgi:hypothetical protein
MALSFRPTEEAALRHVRIELAPAPIKARWLNLVREAIKERVRKDAIRVEVYDRLDKNKITWSDK